MKPNEQTVSARNATYDVGRKVLENTGYELLPSRWLFPNRYPHAISSVASKRAILMNLSGMLTGSEAQKQADMKVCEQFTRCKVSRGVRSSSSAYDYTDVDTRIVVAPEEYQNRYLACLHAKEKLEYGLPGPEVGGQQSAPDTEQNKNQDGKGARKGGVAYTVPVLRNALVSPTKPPRGLCSSSNNNSSNITSRISAKSLASDAQILEDKAKAREARKARAESVAAMRTQQQLEIGKERDGLSQGQENAINEKENAPHGAATVAAADVSVAHGIATSAEKERKASASRRVTLSPTKGLFLTARLICSREEEKGGSSDPCPSTSDAAAVTSSMKRPSVVAVDVPSAGVSTTGGSSEEKFTEPALLDTSSPVDNNSATLPLAGSDEKEVEEVQEVEEVYKTAEEWEAEMEADEEVGRQRVAKQHELMMAALFLVELENQQLMQVVRRKMGGVDAAPEASTIGATVAVTTTDSSGDDTHKGEIYSSSSDCTDTLENNCVAKVDVALAKQLAHARLCVRLEVAKWRYQYEMVCIQLRELVGPVY